jgi:hypothetical protein
MKETLPSKVTSQRNGHPFHKSETGTHEYGAIKFTAFFIFSGGFAHFCSIA